MKEQSKKTVAKKKFFKMVFSRAGIFVILILIQLLVFLGIPYYLKEYATFIYSAMSVMEIVVLVYIINTEGNPAFKMTWMLCVMALPVIGTVFYIYVHLQLETRFVQNRLAALRMETEPYMDQDEKVTEALWASKSANAQLSYYLSHQLGFPTYRNTEVEYFPVGEDKFASMIKELEKAEKFIFMEYFIVADGVMWDSIKAVLKEKAAAGVEVRFVYDDLGSVGCLPKQFRKELSDAGIHVMAFNPFRPALSAVMNNRNHRKITVIDGYIAYTGGFNLADEYINQKKRFGHWKDTGLRIYGEAAYSFTLMCLELWNAFNNTNDNCKKYLPHRYHPEPFPTDGYVLPYCNSPFESETLAQDVYLELLNQAKNYVYIFTPYLAIDDEMQHALCMAAQRGIDVRLVTPGIPDKRMVYSLTRSYYEPLIRAGVRIYEYTPGFIHAKSYLVDDEIGVVGTINMDYRSLYLHMEDAVLLTGCSALQKLKIDCMVTIEKSRRVTLQDCKRRRHSLLWQAILRTISPLL